MRIRAPEAMIATAMALLLCLFAAPQAMATELAPSITAIAPAVSSPASAAYTNDPTPEFVGVGTGVLARVSAAEVSRPLCVTRVSESRWSCGSIPLKDGSYSVMVTVEPGPPHHSVAQTLTIDTVAPATPRITSPGSPGSQGIAEATSSDPRPTISGSGEPGAVITLFDGTRAITGIGGPTVSPSGSWSFTLAGPLSPGVHTISSVQTDRAGNRSPGGPGFPQLRLTIGTASPAAPHSRRRPPHRHPSRRHPSRRPQHRTSRRRPHRRPAPLSREHLPGSAVMSHRGRSDRLRQPARHRRRNCPPWLCRKCNTARTAPETLHGRQSRHSQHRRHPIQARRWTGTIPPPRRR